MGSQLVIDESLSLALNLLLSSFSIGGPSERILLNPTTQLEENGGLMLSEILSLMTRPSALISSNVVVGEEWIGEEIGESTLLSGQRYRLKDTTGKLKLCVLANLLHETVDKMTLSSYHQKANNYSRDSTVNIIEVRFRSYKYCTMKTYLICCSTTFDS